jgi:ribosomal protein L14
MSYIHVRFDNACVLLNAADERNSCFGPVARELQQFMKKIVSLAPEVL